MTEGLRVSLVAAVLIFFYAITEAHADFFIHTWDNHHQVEGVVQANADFRYYTTSTDDDLNGSTFTPSGLNGYHRSLLDLSGIYGITGDLSVFARLSSEISNVNAPTSSYNGSKTGLGDQTLGLNYRIFERQQGLKVDIQFQADLPAYSNTGQTSPSPFLGDATTDLTFGGFLSHPLGTLSDHDLFAVAGMGYTKRSSGFSSALPWSAVARLEPKLQGFVANLGLYGIASLKTDTGNPNNLLSTSVNSYGTGGSYATNAINPSLMSVRGEVGYLTENDFQFTGSIMQSFWGRNAPSGLTLALGIQTHFGSRKVAQLQEGDPRFQSPDDYGKSNRGLVNYNLEAKVVKSNDQYNLVKINKGSDDGVHVGDQFDIFVTKQDGSAGSAIARAQVTDVRSGEAALKVQEYYREVWIEEGFTARRPVR